MKQRVIARAQVVVEVDCGTWSDGEVISAVTERARREAEEKVRIAIQDRSDIRIVSVGRGAVTAVDERDR
jgi:hypothetical protein